MLQSQTAFDVLFVRPCRRLSECLCGVHPYVCKSGHNKCPFARTPSYFFCRVDPENPDQSPGGVCVWRVYSGVSSGASASEE